MTSFMRKELYKGRSQDSGSTWFESFTLTSGESNIFILPHTNVYAIGARQTDGVFYFTIDSYEIIISNPGMVTWLAWDGTSKINNAVTAFKFVWTRDTATGAITVKTAGT
jgi:hypothetical protein